MEPVYEPVREWTCPNHPDGPPDNEENGVPEEVLELVSALADVDSELIPAAARLLMHRCYVALGFCCEGHRWRDKLDEHGQVVMREVPSFILLLRDLGQPSVLLDELARWPRTNMLDGSEALPLTKGGHLRPLTNRDPGDETEIGWAD